MNTQTKINLSRAFIFAIAISASAAGNAWHGGGWHGGGWHGGGWHGGGWHGGWYGGGWRGAGWGGTGVVVGIPVVGYGYSNYYAPSCYRVCNGYGHCWRRCN